MDECARGKPFVGRAGAVFGIALRAAGVSREMVYVTNVVKCMPPHAFKVNSFRTPSYEEVRFCATRFLERELGKANVVVALGNTAFRWLARDGKERPILEWRGCVMEVERDEGRVEAAEAGGRTKKQVLKAMLHGAVCAPWTTKASGAG